MAEAENVEPLSVTESFPPDSVLTDTIRRRSRVSVVTVVKAWRV